jgi:hypothetical protein
VELGEGESMHARLVSQKWDGIVLFRRSRTVYDYEVDTLIMMVQSFDGKITDRMGFVWISKNEVDQLKTSQQTIILA